MQRRTFLTVSALSASRVLGANDTVRVGLIGCGGRGRLVSRLMREAPNVAFVAVADVYKTNAENARQWAGPEARAFSDFRQLLELKDVDAVIVATPDHWHAIATVLACQAGKDVYVEKPLAHNIREGRAMVTAARRHNRIVQAGMQHRSAPHYREVEQIVQSGEIGDVRFVRVWNYSNMAPDGIGSEPDSAPPEGLDWDLYLGPAPLRPFNRKRFLGSFRWFWDYAGGTITDFGTHRFDTVHQVMHAEIPRTVSASGQRFNLRDAGEMPDVLQASYEYPGFVMSYEAMNINGHGCGGRTQGMRYYNANGVDDRPNGEAYYGTKGTLIADRVGYDVYPDEGRRRGAQTASAVKRRSMNSTDATGLHAQHFIDCVRSRKPSAGDVEIGHRSTIVPHIGNIAFKIGRKLTWNGTKEEFENAPDANRLLRREARKPWNLI